MTKPLHPVALFRLSVLGPLASRDHFSRGELKKMLNELAAHTYLIPGSKRTRLSPQAIERWYYAWKQGGIEALEPKVRCDKQRTHLPEAIQTALLSAKQDNPARSLNTLIGLLESQGIVAQGALARASVHRFLQKHQLSKRTLADANTIERRAFVAAHANDIWHADVMHGPTISSFFGRRKVYLVSLLDDASRLIAHADFCWGESALDIEDVLKTAILKRGIPKKIILDNGAAYRASSLQEICARLEIRLVYCPAYEPQGKGKLERYHRTFRALFLNEIQLDHIEELIDLNSRLWAWIDQVYHQRPHKGLDGKTPQARWREDVTHIRPLSHAMVTRFDELFYHRVKRFIRKDGTLSWEGRYFEVPYQHAQHTVYLVFDPLSKQALYIESEAGENLGPVTPLDKLANSQRHRQRPAITQQTTTAPKPKIDAVEIAYQQYNSQLIINNIKGD